MLYERMRQESKVGIITLYHGNHKFGGLLRQLPTVIQQKIHYVEILYHVRKVCEIDNLEMAIFFVGTLCFKICRK